MSNKIWFSSVLIAALIGSIYFIWPTSPPLPTEEGERKGPGQFLEWHQRIRTRDGDTGPAYAANYRLNELTRALNSPFVLGKRAIKLDWQERGPFNISGRTRAIVVDIADPNGDTWFVGTAGGGIWKTTNAGRSWTDKTPLLPNLATISMVQSPSNPDILYAGTGEGFNNVDAIRGDGIFVSKDRGETWKQLVATASNNDFKFVNRLVIDPQNPDILLAGTNTGVFKTTDGGISWRNVMGGWVQQLMANPLNFKTLYAARNGNGVYKSVNKGETWTKTEFGITDGFGRMEIATTAQDTSLVYAAVVVSVTVNNTKESDSRLMISRDGAQTWNAATYQRVSGNLKANWMGDQGWYDNTIAVSPLDKNEVFVGGIDIVRLTINPSGNTFLTTHLTSGYGGAGCQNYFGSACIAPSATADVHVDQHLLVPFKASGNTFRLLAANDGGIALSNDAGNNWIQFDGIQSTQFYGASKKPLVQAYFGGMQDNGTWFSNDNAEATTPWVNAMSGDGFEVLWHQADPKMMIGASQYNGVSRSVNGGASFQSLSNLTDRGQGKGPFISLLANSPQLPDRIFAVGSTGVWRSNDFGTNWEAKKPGEGWNWSGADVRVSLANPNIIWTGNGITGGRNFYVSTNGGDSYAVVSGYSTTLGNVSSIATHPSKDSTAYALYSISNAPKILRTNDLGKTWEDISGFGTGTLSNNGFPNVAVYSLLVLPHAPETLWVGTEIGLFESTDNGTTWHYADNGLPAVAIWTMEVVDDEVVLGTHGRGVWSVKIPALLTHSFQPPVIKTFGQITGEPPVAEFVLRTVYDSTWVFVNQTKVGTYPKNEPGVLLAPDLNNLTAKSLTMTIRVFKGRKSLELTRSITGLSPFGALLTGIATDFDTPESNSLFFTPGSVDGDAIFSISTATGFMGRAIHTSHPVSIAPGSNYVFQMTNKITVAGTSSEAFMEYDEIAILRPGTTGSKYPDFEFGGYVVPEGSKDGKNWVALASGVNSSAYTEWRAAYSNKANGTPSLIKRKKIDLLKTFKAGDKINIRFQLLNPSGTLDGWGWMADNLEIQKRQIVPVEQEPLPQQFSLAPNYPNPFNPETTIRFTLRKSGWVNLQVFDLNGRLVRTLVNQQKEAGHFNVQFMSNDLPSGTYLYRLKTSEGVLSRKMTLLK
ncbi:MAG: T9SS type A sorting domain-containing protein [Bacteroidetes Order II. Incertae sedis bacterium]|nr:T9SS type A sorting domain-containing protein [Bacteroidetes Order II. bacterium]